jgi:hypothetical protein
MNSDFGASAPLNAESSSAFSLNFLIALNRFEVETYYWFNKMPINAHVSTTTLNFEVKKNESAQLTRYMFAPEKLVQPNIQVGVLFMRAKVVRDISAPASLQTGVTTFVYDARISTFLGAGRYCNLKPVGFAVNY